MVPVGLARTTTILPVVAFLKDAGVSVDRVLAAADLPAWITSQPEGLIPATSRLRLIRAATRHADIPNLGLTAGERHTIETAGVFGGLMRGARTLGAMLDSAVRYTRMVTSDGRPRLRDRGDRVELWWKVAPGFDPRDAGWQQAEQHRLGVMLAFVRLALGPAWRPAEVHLQTDESPGLRDAESLAAVRVAFRQPATMVAIPRALLATPLPPPPPTDVPMEIGRWKSSAPVRDFAGSIRQAIETLSYGEDYPSVRQTADFVGMSVRTLQRDLAAAGVSHEVLVAQTRFATAAAVLERTNAKILDLALNLGYSDHANFTRAFRRWAGCSPQEYRSTHGRWRHVGNRPPGASGTERRRAS
jgi:AraC-like DNA-binding protein